MTKERNLVRKEETGGTIALCSPRSGLKRSREGEVTRNWRQRPLIVSCLDNSSDSGPRNSVAEGTRDMGTLPPTSRH